MDTRLRTPCLIALALVATIPWALPSRADSVRVVPAVGLTLPNQTVAVAQVGTQTGAAANGAAANPGASRPYLPAAFVPGGGPTVISMDVSSLPYGKVASATSSSLRQSPGPATVVPSVVPFGAPGAGPGRPALASPSLLPPAAPGVAPEVPVSSGPAAPPSAAPPASPAPEQPVSAPPPPASAFPPALLPPPDGPLAPSYIDALLPQAPPSNGAGPSPALMFIAPLRVPAPPPQVPTGVPLPGSLPMLVIGLAAIGAFRAHRRR